MGTVVGEAMVGLFWYTDSYEIFLKDRYNIEDTFADHYTVWKKSIMNGELKEPYNKAEWNAYKRGRVEYNPWGKDSSFIVYSGESCSNGKCTNSRFVSMVKNAFDLMDGTKWEYSAHYNRNENMMNYGIDGQENID